MVKGLVRNILVPCNKLYFDIDGALKDLKEIHYRQYINVEIGALAFIYVGSPFEQALVYLCKVTGTNETENLIDDDKYALKPDALKNGPGRYMRIKLIKELDPALFDFHTLREHGLKTCLQGQCYVSEELQEYIDRALNIDDVFEELDNDEVNSDDLLDKMNISYAISPDNAPEIRKIKTSKRDGGETSDFKYFQRPIVPSKFTRRNKGYQLRIIDREARRKLLEAHRTRHSLLIEDEDEIKVKQRKGAKVNYSIVSENIIKKNSNFLISFTMYEDKFKKIAKQIKKQYENPNEKKGTLENIALGTNITTVMSSVDIPSIKDEQKFTWLGKYYTCEFSGFVPKEYDKNSFVISFDIYVNGVKVTRLKTIINLKNNSAGMLVFSKEDVKRIFFSYSSQDRDIVLNIVNKINESFNYDIDFFLDVLSLRAGDNWKERIYNEINLSDTFCLIWSKNAYRSTWVEIEWKYALKKKGLGCINPINLEPNDKSLPIPKELEKIHFAYYPLLV